MSNAQPGLAAKTPIPRLRAYDGPAVLSYGFRPSFSWARPTPGSRS
jgi:hypothetical protein